MEIKKIEGGPFVQACAAPLLLVDEFLNLLPGAERVAARSVTGISSDISRESGIAKNQPVPGMTFPVSSFPIFGECAGAAEYGCEVLGAREAIVTPSHVAAVLAKWTQGGEPCKRVTCYKGNGVGGVIDTTKKAFEDEYGPITDTLKVSENEPLTPGRILMA